MKTEEWLEPHRGIRWLAGSIGVAGLALAAHACAADVFVSTAPDGSLRYATQALDASYRLSYHETPPPDQGPLQATAPETQVQNPKLQSLIERAADRHGVPVALVSAVAGVESGLNSHAISAKGAYGVMQLMPATAARYGLRGSRALADPQRNIDAGVRYLKDLLAQHHGNVALALAAYNAGPQAVTQHRDRIPPYRETMLYVAAVMARSAALSIP